MATIKRALAPFFPSLLHKEDPENLKTKSISAQEPQPVIELLLGEIPLLPSSLAWIEIDAQVLFHFYYYISS